MRNLQSIEVWHLLCLISVFTGALSSDNEDQKPFTVVSNSRWWEGIQKTPIGISNQNGEETIIPELTCISANASIVNIMQDSKDHCKGDDYKVTFYLRNKKKHYKLGSLVVDKYLFHDVLMKYSNWSLTSEKLDSVNKENPSIYSKEYYHMLHDNQLEHVKEPQPTDSICDCFSYIDGVNTNVDNNKLNNVDKQYFNINPSYNSEYKHYEFAVPENIHELPATTINVYIDKNDKNVIENDVKEEIQNINYNKNTMNSTLDEQNLRLGDDESDPKIPEVVDFLFDHDAYELNENTPVTFNFKNSLDKHFIPSQLSQVINSYVIGETGDYHIDNANYFNNVKTEQIMCNTDTDISVHPLNLNNNIISKEPVDISVVIANSITENNSKESARSPFLTTSDVEETKYYYSSSKDVKSKYETVDVSTDTHIWQTGGPLSDKKNNYNNKNNNNFFEIPNVRILPYVEYNSQSPEYFIQSNDINFNETTYEYSGEDSLRSKIQENVIPLSEYYKMLPLKSNLIQEVNSKVNPIPVMDFLDEAKEPFYTLQDKKPLDPITYHTPGNDRIESTYVKPTLDGGVANVVPIEILPTNNNPDIDIQVLTPKPHPVVNIISSQVTSAPFLDSQPFQLINTLQPTPTPAFTPLKSNIESNQNIITPIYESLEKTTPLLRPNIIQFTTSSLPTNAKHKVKSPYGLRLLNTISQADTSILNIAPLLQPNISSQPLKAATIYEPITTTNLQSITMPLKSTNINLKELKPVLDDNVLLPQKVNADSNTYSYNTPVLTGHVQAIQQKLNNYSPILQDIPSYLTPPTSSLVKSQRDFRTMLLPTTPPAVFPSTEQSIPTYTNMIDIPAPQTTKAFYSLPSLSLQSMYSIPPEDISTPVSLSGSPPFVNEPVLKEVIPLTSPCKISEYPTPTYANSFSNNVTTIPVADQSVSQTTTMTSLPNYLSLLPTYTSKLQPISHISLPTGLPITPFSNPISFLQPIRSLTSPSTSYVRPLKDKEIFPAITPIVPLSTPIDSSNIQLITKVAETLKYPETSFMPISEHTDHPAISNINTKSLKDILKTIPPQSTVHTIPVSDQYNIKSTLPFNLIDSLKPHYIPFVKSFKTKPVLPYTNLPIAKDILKPMSATLPVSEFSPTPKPIQAALETTTKQNFKPTSIWSNVQATPSTVLPISSSEVHTRPLLGKEINNVNKALSYDSHKLPPIMPLWKEIEIPITYQPQTKITNMLFSIMDHYNKNKYPLKLSDSFVTDQKLDTYILPSKSLDDILKSSGAIFTTLPTKETSVCPLSSLSSSSVPNTTPILPTPLFTSPLSEKANTFLMKQIKSPTSSYTFQPHPPSSDVTPLNSNLQVSPITQNESPSFITPLSYPNSLEYKDMPEIAPQICSKMTEIFPHKLPLQFEKPSRIPQSPAAYYPLPQKAISKKEPFNSNSIKTYQSIVTPAVPSSLITKNIDTMIMSEYNPASAIPSPIVDKEAIQSIPSTLASTLFKYPQYLSKQKEPFKPFLKSQTHEALAIPVHAIPFNPISAPPRLTSVPLESQPYSLSQFSVLETPIISNLQDASSLDKKVTPDFTRNFLSNPYSELCYSAYLRPLLYSDSTPLNSYTFKMDPLIPITSDTKPYTIPSLAMTNQNKPNTPSIANMNVLPIKTIEEMLRSSDNDKVKYHYTPLNTVKLIPKPLMITPSVSFPIHQIVSPLQPAEGQTLFSSYMKSSALDKAIPQLNKASSQIMFSTPISSIFASKTNKTPVVSQSLPYIEPDIIRSTPTGSIPKEFSADAVIHQLHTVPYYKIAEVSPSSLNSGMIGNLKTPLISPLAITPNYLVRNKNEPIDTLCTHVVNPWTVPMQIQTSLDTTISNQLLKPKVTRTGTTPKITSDSNILFSPLLAAKSDLPVFAPELKPIKALPSLVSPVVPITMPDNKLISKETLSPISSSIPCQYELLSPFASFKPIKSYSVGYQKPSSSTTGVSHSSIQPLFIPANNQITSPNLLELQPCTHVEHITPISPVRWPNNCLKYPLKPFIPNRLQYGDWISSSRITPSALPPIKYAENNPAVLTVIRPFSKFSYFYSNPPNIDTTPLEWISSTEPNQTSLLYRKPISTSPTKSLYDQCTSPLCQIPLKSESLLTYSVPNLLKWKSELSSIPTITSPFQPPEINANLIVPPKTPISHLLSLKLLDTVSPLVKTSIMPETISLSPTYANQITPILSQSNVNILQPTVPRSLYSMYSSPITLTSELGTSRSKLTPTIIGSSLPSLKPTPTVVPTPYSRPQNVEFPQKLLPEYTKYSTPSFSTTIHPLPLQYATPVLNLSPYLPLSKHSINLPYDEYLETVSIPVASPQNKPSKNSNTPLLFIPIEKYLTATPENYIPQVSTMAPINMYPLNKVSKSSAYNQPSNFVEYITPEVSHLSAKLNNVNNIIRNYTEISPIAHVADYTSPALISPFKKQVAPMSSLRQYETSYTTPTYLAPNRLMHSPLTSTTFNPSLIKPLATPCFPYTIYTSLIPQTILKALPIEIPKPVPITSTVVSPITDNVSPVSNLQLTPCELNEYTKLSATYNLFTSPLITPKPYHTNPYLSYLPPKTIASAGKAQFSPISFAKYKSIQPLVLSSVNKEFSLGSKPTITPMNSKLLTSLSLKELPPLKTPYTQTRKFTETPLTPLTNITPLSVSNFNTENLRVLSSAPCKLTSEFSPFSYTEYIQPHKTKILTPARFFTSSQASPPLISPLSPANLNKDLSRCESTIEIFNFLRSKIQKPQPLPYDPTYINETPYILAEHNSNSLSLSSLRNDYICKPVYSINKESPSSYTSLYSTFYSNPNTIPTKWQEIPVNHISQPALDDTRYIDDSMFKVYPIPTNYISSIPNFNPLPNHNLENPLYTSSEYKNNIALLQNEIRTKLHNYINNNVNIKSDLHNTNADLNIPLGEISIAKKESISPNIHSINPSVSLRMWTSNLKLVEAKLQLTFKDIPVNNFQPVVGNLNRHDKTEIEKQVKNYIQNKFGNVIVINNNNPLNSQYDVIKNCSNICDNRCNLLWPADTLNQWNKPIIVHEGMV